MTTAVKGRVCRHCKDRRANRARGLCWTCYYTPGISRRYGPLSKYGRRGVPEVASGAMPSTPTEALPGTPAKVLVLAARAAQGETLWHPQDKKA